MPIRLWSTVVSQDQMTGSVLGLARAPGMKAAWVAMKSLLFQAEEIGGQGLALLAPNAEVGHERARLHVPGVLDPLGHVLGGIQHQVGPKSLAAAEMRQVGPHGATRDAADSVAADAGRLGEELLTLPGQIARGLRGRLP